MRLLRYWIRDAGDEGPPGGLGHFLLSFSWSRVPCFWHPQDKGKIHCKGWLNSRPAQMTLVTQACRVTVRSLLTCQIEHSRATLMSGYNACLRVGPYGSQPILPKMATPA